MLEWLPIAFFFALGLAVGSHVNVLVLRFGFEERSSPRSECPQCGARLTALDLIPVLSYLALRGRCRSCRSAISLQYPLVELGTGILFALAYVTHAPALAGTSTALALAFAGFAALLTFLAAAVAVTAYDARHTLIPLPFVYVLGASALLYRTLEAAGSGSAAPLIDAGLGALAVGGFFLAVVLISRGRGMGMGDAYIACAVGAVLGLTKGVTAAAFGVWSATIVYLILMASSSGGLFGRKRRVTMKTELPFAPWLLFGAIVVLFTGFSLLQVSGWLLMNA